MLKPSGIITSMPQYIRLRVVLKTFAVILLLLSIQQVTAQTNYGITGGAGKSSLYKFPVPPQDFDGYSSQGAWWLGLKIGIPLVKNNLDLVITPTFSSKGYKYAFQKETGTNNTLRDSSFKQNINFAEININFRKKFMFDEESPNHFFVGTGPVINFFAGGKEKISASYFGTMTPAVNKSNSSLTTGSAAGQYAPWYFGWGFTIGFAINHLSVWLNANLPFGTYYQDLQNDNDHKIKTFGLNAGYTLFTHQKKEREKKEKKERKPKTHHEDKPVINNVPDSLIDTDGDGIVDKNDKCPTVKGTLKYNGCPVPDTDGDGVNDDIDKCITVPGTAANNGCPADTNKVAKPDTTCFTIYFEPGKSILRSEAYATLTTVVQMLKANPKLVAVFTGHTDNVGSEAANYNRSLLRASVSADYVASFYIDRKRLTIISMGNKTPAADLNDPLLQWKNRRVEVCVFENK